MSDIAAASTLLPEVTAAVSGDGAGLVFLHVAVPDSAGHAQGFMSQAYLDAVVAADREIGQLLDLVEFRPALRRSVTIIVIADHGGVPPGHRFPEVLGNRRIPFFVWGRGIQSGADLYALHSGSRSDPVPVIRRTTDRSRSANGTRPPWPCTCRSAAAARDHQSSRAAIADISVHDNRLTALWGDTSVVRRQR